MRKCKHNTHVDTLMHNVHAHVCTHTQHIGIHVCSHRHNAQIIYTFARTTHIPTYPCTHSAHTTHVCSLTHTCTMHTPVSHTLHAHTRLHNTCTHAHTRTCIYIRSTKTGAAPFLPCALPCTERVCDLNVTGGTAVSSFGLYFVF